MPAPTATKPTTRRAGTKAAIKRAIEATVAAGLTPCAVVVSRDGTIRVETSSAKELDEQQENGKSLRPAAWPPAKGV